MKISKFIKFIKQDNRDLIDDERRPATEQELRNSDLNLTEDQIKHALKMNASIAHIRWAQMH